MSMMGQLKFFIELQIKHILRGVYINLTKYVKEVQHE